MSNSGQNDKTSKENLLKGLSLEEHAEEKEGVSWFFGIGINAYKHFPPLNNAVNDIKDVAKLLQNQYELDSEHTILLFDEAATMDNIIIKLDYLRSHVSKDDKLIVYYSGHGHLDSSNKGYWIPVDAQRENTAHYIRNSTLRDYIEDISSRHTLIISDSCFSGSLFLRGINRADFAIEELEQRPSRWALCSGRHDEHVFDGEPGKNSPFTESILDILRSNRLPKLNVAKLADRVIELTRANYEQLPEGNPLYGLGHKGGQYVFKLRASEDNLWGRCERENTIAAFNAYLDQFPSGRFAGEAIQRIQTLEDEKKWLEALQIDQVYTYRDYLRRFPEGKHEVEARERVRQLEQPDSYVKENSLELNPNKNTTTYPQPQPVEKRNLQPSSSSWRRILLIGLGMLAISIGIWLIRFVKDNLGPDESEITGIELFEFQGKFGYRDPSGKEVIAAQYESAEPFSNGRARVTLNGQTYFIDATGVCVADCPLVGAVIRGQIFYGGFGSTLGVISDFSNAEATIRLIDREANKELSIKYDYNPQTGHYSIYDVPPGKYGPSVTIESGYPFNKVSGGDYISYLTNLNEEIIVVPNEKNIFRNLNVIHSIHIKRPVNNQEERTFANDPPEILYRQNFQPSSEIFEWDPVPGATRYKVEFSLTELSTGNNIDFKVFNTEKPHIIPDLRINEGNTYYRFTLEAFSSNSPNDLIGLFSNYYKDGAGDFLEFKVLEKPY
ncbi:MAG: caspase family protein [Saprospiraceae bacterium]|nr:caspase family protein [Saprospiraceae bacterium]